MWIRPRMPTRFWLRFNQAHRRAHEKSPRLLAIVLPGLFLIAPLLQGEPALLSPQMAAHCALGFEQLYSMDYAAAKAHFEEMTRIEPRHPAGYVYLASAVWLEHLASLRRLQFQIYNRNNAFFMAHPESPDPNVEKLFYANITKAIARANARLKQNDHDLAGLYYLGVADGAVAGYESTVKRAFLSSLQNGKKAVDLHKKVLKFYPDFADADVSVGMYNYVVGTLPVAAKILLLIGGVHGSREQGLEQLENAAAHAMYARDEASVILALLYDREKRDGQALKILQGLSDRYPRNFLFRFEIAGMLSKTGHISEAMAAYDRLMHDENARDHMLDLIHFEYGEIFFSMQSWQKAYEHFLMARRVMDHTPQGLISMTHLKAGLCLNAMHRDKEANVEYQFVLNQPELNDSHKLAKTYMKKPFRP
jgi:tetratricopeptide (TPR) repeat protein